MMGVRVLGVSVAIAVAVGAAAVILLATIAADFALDDATMHIDAYQPAKCGMRPLILWNNKTGVEDAWADWPDADFPPWEYEWNLPRQSYQFADYSFPGGEPDDQEEGEDYDYIENSDDYNNKETGTKTTNGETNHGEERPPPLSPRAARAERAYATRLRMSNGWPAEQAEFPSFVSIRTNWENPLVDPTDCSGAIIHKDLVLTTADCIANTSAPGEIPLRRYIIANPGGPFSDWQVFAFDVGLDTVTASALPNEANEYNFGIIRLPENIRFMYHEAVQPACIYRYKQAQPPLPDACVTMGFGVKDDYGGWWRTKLMAIPMYWRTCWKRWAEDMRCWMARKKKWAGNPCAGDYGAPMLCQHWERWHVVGNYVGPYQNVTCKPFEKHASIYTELYGGQDTVKVLIKRILEKPYPLPTKNRLHMRIK